MQKLLLLTVSFVIIGIGAYGGGLVTVPLMQHELVEIRNFLSMEEMSRIVAIAQITPGPISVNAATFVGYRVCGLGGALLTSAVVVLPAILILSGLSHIQERMAANPHLLRVRRGLRAGILSLLLFATWSYGRGVVTAFPELVIAIAAFLILTLFEKKVHPLAVIAGAGLVGILIF
ncbi:MAG: chromate transporter [Sedimentisphaerales bacterium]|nr:chromate transporter [Sedimentisphaerales bacterium]